MTTDSATHSGHHGDSHVAHHFKDSKHQYESSKEGIWLFMTTEILMFGGLFVAYAIFNSLFSEMFAEGATHLDWRLGFINTLVLIFSSFTMALGVLYCQKDQIQKAAMALGATVLCGGIFMVVKYIEYSDKFAKGMLPGKFFSYEGAEAANLGLYFSFYYVMTGLHGIHVVLGMGLITWCLIRCLRGDFSSRYYTPVEGVGIFWHIVDLIWIYLFPILYLIG